MDWTFPYPSQRVPVFARNVVATSQPLAAQAGLDAMRRGGNAIDAALASAIALTVVEPTMNGIGSDAFALVWDGQTLQGLNSSGRSPRAWTREHFDRYSEMPRQGWDCVTTPGCVAAWVELSDRFGALAFRDLFDAAIAYAESGFAVSPITAQVWNYCAEYYKSFEGFQSTFIFNGRAPRAGEVVHLPDHARSLEDIAVTQGESFYRGDLARRISQYAADSGGLLGAQDLAAHTADWVEPMGVDLGEYRLHEIPPNGQGLAALIALGVLQRTSIATSAVDSADSLHLQLEAMKIGIAEAATHIADRDSMRVEPEALLRAEVLDQHAERIELGRAKKHASLLPSSPDTVYLTAADADGRMVSYIQSNFFAFGSGIVVPGTGIALQNRGSGFSLERGHPNEVGPGKRPFHTIIPGFVTRGDQPVMSFGVMGGPMQPQGHVQVMVRVFVYDQNPQAAADAPRWQVLGDGRVALEPGFAPDVIEDLETRGHRIETANPAAMGGAQLVYRLEDGYCAASDPRKDGQAVGF